MTKRNYEFPSQVGATTDSTGAHTIGVMTGIDEQGRALVRFSESGDAPVAIALSVVAVVPDRIGARVAVAFSNNEPIIMGFIHSPLERLLTAVDSIERPEAEHAPRSAYIDGKRIVLDAKEEIVLQCGDASIALTHSGKQAQITIRCGEATLTLGADGKVVIRGKHIVNRSDGVNRLLGSTITLN